MKDGAKFLLLLTIGCQQVITGAPGTGTEPGTLKSICGPVGTSVPPEKVPVKPGEKFRVLTGVSADSVVLYRLPRGVQPGQDVALNSSLEVARGEIQDKAARRWRFELRAPINYDLVRIVVTPADPQLRFAAFDFAVANE